MLMFGKKVLSPSFRYILIEKLLRSMQAGDSAAVVGVASVGKSNVVQALQQRDIQMMHLEQESQLPLLVWLDANDLTALEPWYFFELLLYRLIFHADRVNIAPAIVTYLEDAYTRLLGFENNPNLALLVCQEALRWLCQTHQVKVVLLLDEFDLLFEALPEGFFRNLRSMRDKNKYNLVYILFLRQELATLRPSLSEVEAFAELFQAHTHYLQPDDLTGTEQMLMRLAERFQIEWPTRQTSIIFDWSGGHAGLNKVIFRKILPQLNARQTSEFAALTEDAEVLDECQKIWDSLDDDERHCLQQIVRPSPEIAAEFDLAVQRLRLKGLINHDQNHPLIHSKLLSDFVQQTTLVNVVEAGFAFDSLSRICKINNQEINLPLLPAKLLELLYSNRGKPCRRLDVLQYLYPEEDHSQLNRLSDDPRLYDVVKNLRKKIEPNPQKPRYVKTVRGMGFKLDI